EDERFDVVGQQSLVRRNLSSYARFLGMDPAEVVQEFASLQGEPEPSSIEELDRKNREAPKPKRPKWLIAAIASGFALTVAVGADGGTVRLTLNGTELGPPGSSGTVFRARYGPHGKISHA